MASPPPTPTQTRINSVAYPGRWVVQVRDRGSGHPWVDLGDPVDGLKQALVKEEAHHRATLLNTPS